MKDLETAKSLVSWGDYEAINLVYDKIPTVLSELVRTAFIAPEGKLLIVSDFSSIEARVLAWLAGEQWKIDVFRKGEDVYKTSASLMYNVPVEEITKESGLRQKGKISELAFGYQGAVGALEKIGGNKTGWSQQEMKAMVSLWRRNNPEIVKLWGIVEAKATRAIKSKREVTYRNLAFNHEHNLLTIQLPSGRKLFYREPTFRNNRWGNSALNFKGIDGTSRKWTYIETYGGKMVENIVQAIARDLLAHCMQILDRKKYAMNMHVHDEVVAEVSEEQAPEKLKEMIEIMSTEIPWAKGLPLAADGYATKFYKKD